MVGFSEILNSNWQTLWFIYGPFILTLLGFKLHVEFRKSSVFQRATTLPILGYIMQKLLESRKKAIQGSLERLLPSRLEWEWKREIVTRTAARISAICLISILGFFIYEYFLIGPGGIYEDYFGSITIPYGVQLQALGSLALAYEAVVAGHNRLADYSGSVSQATKLRQDLRQQTKEYILRFTGATLLAIGYLFPVLVGVYTRNFGGFDLGFEPIWLLFIPFVLVVGVERSLTQFFGLSSATFFLISITIYWTLFGPVDTFAALAIFALLYIYERYQGYPGIGQIVYRQFWHSE